MTEIKEVTFYLCWLTLVYAVVVTVKVLCTQRIANNIWRKLKSEAYEKILYKDMAFYDKKEIGELLSKLGSSLEKIQKALSTNI